MILAGLVLLRVISTSVVSRAKPGGENNVVNLSLSFQNALRFQKQSSFTVLHYKVNHTRELA